MSARLSGQRIVLTTDAVGGVWRYAVDLAVTLSARGLSVSLLGLGPAPSAHQRAEAARAGLRLAWLERDLDWMLDGPEAAEDLAQDLAAALQREGCDLVHLNSPALAGTGALPLPTVAAAHSCLATWWRALRGSPQPAAWAWHRRLTGSGLRRAAFAVAPSRSFAADLEAVYGRLENLRVVPNGASAVTTLPKEPYVLTAGRWWDEAKGARAIDAAAGLIDWPVQAAGPTDGPDGVHVRLRTMLDLGCLGSREMAERLGRAPIFVSVSRYEPFGLAVLEAASAGAALVLSDIPTFRELWGEAAVFVDPVNPDGIASAANTLIHDAGLRGRLGAAARERAGRYTTERQANAFMALYAETLARHSPAKVPA